MIERIQKDIADCSLGEIRGFLSDVLGVPDLHGRETLVQLQAKLAQVGYTVKFITVPFEYAASMPDAVRPTDTDRYRTNEDGSKSVKIIIQTSDRAGGDRPVPVGVNGRIMLIPRGTPVWVPESYVEVLKHAVEHAYDEYDADSNIFGGLQARKDVSAYPFSYA
jgi:hypothetical protein